MTQFSVMTPRFRPLQSLPALALCCTACVALSSRGDEVVRRDSSGVTIVENTGTDRLLPWTYEISFRLGGRPDGPEMFYEIEASQVATDSAGGIYVLDGENHRVVKFDARGDVTWVAGRQGGGPGELMRPFGIYVDGRGTTHVMDYGKRALVRYDSTGAFAGQAPLGRGMSDVTPVGPTTLAGRRNYGEDGVMISEVVSIQGTDTTVFVQAPAVRTASYRVEGCGFPVGSTGPVIFGKELDWTLSSGMVIVSSIPEYAVDVWNHQSGRLQTSIRRAVPARAATRTLAIQWAEITKPHRVGRRDGGECVPPPGEVVDKRGFADSLPVIDGVQVDRAGRFWVKRFTIDPSQSPIDILAADGTYVGTLRADFPWPVAFAPDRLLFVERDALDIERLVVARIITGATDP